MNSIEKINALGQEYMGPPPEDPDPVELLMRSAIQMVGPSLIAMLPEDPAMLDALIEEMSDRLLALRSDDADTIESDAIEEPGAPELAAGDA